MARTGLSWNTWLAGMLGVVLVAEVVWLHTRLALVLPSDAGGVPQTLAAAFHDPAIILFCYNRPDYLNSTLTSLASLPGLQRYALYISQDGNDSNVEEVVAAHHPILAARARAFEHWQRDRVPLLGPNQAGHAWLAQHYRWGLERVLHQRGHSHAVIIEDDMLFSPDFLTLFGEAAWLLAADPTIWCISSWNDNGFAKGHDWDEKRLFRTSYFPGLGWMMARELWDELRHGWPALHWDHWMRMDGVSRGRDCVSPELSRNRNIGEKGANMDSASFRRSLGSMGWAEAAPSGGFGDLRYLLRDEYEAELVRQLALAPVLDMAVSARARAPHLPARLEGTHLVPYLIENHARLATRVKVWSYPRGHYRHVTSVPWRGGRLLLVDVRRCQLLREELRVWPASGMAALVAPRNVSCIDACAAHGTICSRDDLHFVNDCSALRKHLECPGGCSVEWGPDLPNMVALEVGVDNGGGVCYTTQKMPACRGASPYSQRLCACVPQDTPGAAERLETEVHPFRVGWRKKKGRSGKPAEPAGTA